MHRQDLARYIEANNGMTQPWLFVQLPMKKLQERRHKLTQEEYLAEMVDLHRATMDLGEWWKGIEDEVF